MILGTALVRLVALFPPSAATSSARLDTTKTCAASAVEPPVVPGPSAAQPSFGARTARPKAAIGPRASGIDKGVSPAAATAGGAGTNASAATPTTAIDRRILMTRLSSRAGNQSITSICRYVATDSGTTVGPERYTPSVSGLMGHWRPGR